MMPNQAVLAVLGIGIIAVLFAIIHSSLPITAVKLTILLCAVIPSVFIYLKEKRVPNEIIFAAAGIRLILAIFEVITLNDVCASILMRDFLGGIFGSGIIILINLVFGDVFTKDEIKIFTIMGIYSGYACTYATLIFAIIVSYIVKLAVIYKSGAKKNVKIPLEPFLLCGYVIMMMLFRI